ncbi:MAG: gluconokinase [bacterium]|nr:gluconokinase [bacterium]
MSRVIYIMGVAGSGKSSIGRQFAEATGLPFYDGDDFHPKANVEKMAAGQPLTDEDRAGWLAAIHQFAVEQLEAGASLVLACSALKARYRTTLSAGIENQTTWVYLEGSYDLIKSRMEARKGHFMPPALLQSQFDALEPPADAVVLSIDAAPEVLVSRLRERIF